MDINQFLRDTHQWMEKIQSSALSNPITTIAATVIRAKSMHEEDGPLDLAHGSNSRYSGNAEMGNFLFAINLRAMGYSENAIHRLSAAYQARTTIGEWNFESATQAAVNFAMNEGDPPEDTAMLTRAIRYHDEVFLNNQSSSSSLSCIDMETTGGSSGSQNPGTGGGGEGTPVPSTFTPGVIINGTNWCFRQSGFPTYCWFEPH